MRSHSHRLLAAVIAIALTHPPGALCQVTRPSAIATESDIFNPEQLDALLAPVALYPDTLLTQLLMASTFPVQVLQAARWLDNADNKKLSGDALAKALEAESWDPSVKSLVPFPQVIATMSDQADWTQQLGYAFANQEQDVLASIQRLRRQAQEAGTLKSGEQILVRTQPESVSQAVIVQAPPPANGAPASPQPQAAAATTPPQPTVAAGAPQTIVIESANPQVVYVPTYNPAVAYGPWPYAAYPPVALPPPPGYVAGNALLAGLAFGTGVAIVSALWNVGSPNWSGGNVNVNVNRYNSINANRTQIHSNRWQAARPNAAAGRTVRPPAGPVGRPARVNGLPANAIGRPAVRVPVSAVGTRPPQTTAGAAAPKLQPSRTGDTGAQGRAQSGASRPGPANRPGTQNAKRAVTGRQAATQRPAALNDIRDGRQANNFQARGAQSRQFQNAGKRPVRPAGGPPGGDGGRLQRH